MSLLPSKLTPEQLFEVIRGCKDMPQFFIEIIISEIYSLCFTKLKHEEEFDARLEKIKNTWDAVKVCEQYDLLYEFAVLALQSKRLDSKTAKDIAYYLASNHLTVFARLVQEEIGFKIYGIAMAKAIHRYYSQGWIDIKTMASKAETDDAKVACAFQGMDDLTYQMREALR